MIRTWAGPLPAWMPEFNEQMRRVLSRAPGWEFMLMHYEYAHELDTFKSLVFKKLGVRVSPAAGSRKICEFDPALGLIYSNILEGFDFWGHYNLDCVYGRIERYVTDELLAATDIFAAEPYSICGPFTIYRNCSSVNDLFRLVYNWQDVFQDPEFHGFDEGAFADVVRQAAANGKIRFTCPVTLNGWHAHDKQVGHTEEPQITLRNDGTLSEFNTREIILFHFNRLRRWPIHTVAA